MKVFGIVIFSVLFLVVCRFAMLLLAQAACFIYSRCSKKPTTIDENTQSFELVLSVGFLLLFLVGYSSMVLFLVRDNVIKDIEAYLIFSFVGLFSILWCYLRWDLNWKSVPYFDFSSNSIPVLSKKTIIFSFLVLVNFVYGFSQLKKIVNGSPIDTSVLAINSILIPGMIAFDRVLSHFCMLKRKHDEEKGKVKDKKINEVQKGKDKAIKGKKDK